MYRSRLGDFESPKAEQFYINVLRRMTPEQKWLAALELWQMTVEISRAGVRANHPDWPEAHVQAEIGRRILDENHIVQANPFLPVINQEIEMDSTEAQQRDFLFRTIDALEQANIPYAVTGSWASTTYGMPRTTHDLDVIASLRIENVAPLVSAFPPPFYADAGWIREAVVLGEFFNIIDPTLGLKIDFWPLKDDAYSREQFARRRQVNLLGRSIWMLTPEDIILAKLLWYKMSESELQMRDIVSVWKAQQDTLDLDYLRSWATRLSISDLLAKVMAS
jgi:hypothetical protein